MSFIWNEELNSLNALTVLLFPGVLSKFYRKFNAENIENNTKMEKSEDLLEKQNPKASENGEAKKLRYPLQVFFIISNEFCERCMIYGMRSEFN